MQLIGLFALLALSQALPKSSYSESELVSVVETPSLRRSEGERKFTINAFGTEYDLALTRSDGVLPENLLVHIFGEDDDGQVTMEDWTHRTDGAQALYTDQRLGSSIFLDEIHGDTRLTGRLTEDLVIEPKVSIDIDDVEKRSVESIVHVVYKVHKPSEVTTKTDYEIAPESEESDRPDESVNAREKREVAQEIYVPVHVVVDYALWKKLDRSKSDVITYLKIFYNSINSLYSTIQWPAVRVSIQGITICQTKAACKMVESGLVGTDLVDASFSLKRIAEYAYQEKGRTGESYALMIVMTGYDLCSGQGTCKRSTAGLAYVATVCSSFSSFLKKTSRVGIAEDSGSFDGLKTTAHEMGHILGMKHDGDGPASTGAPGARTCVWSNNYIMGLTGQSPNQWLWSRCSVDQLRWMVAQSKADCVLDKPKASPYPLSKKLPGKVLDIDNQCKAQYGPTSANGCTTPGVRDGNDKLCQGLMCKTSRTGCTSSSPAAEGSYCGPQRYCRQGKCVCDPTAPLPTAPPEPAGCTADDKWVKINGKSCTALFSSSDGLRHCNGDLAKKYCCKSRTRYCKADPISCDGSVAPTRPAGKAPTRPPTTVPPPKEKYTKRPENKAADICPGQKCEDTPNILINRMSCDKILSTASLKKKYCDIANVVTHCCATRAAVCNGFHWITDSCDSKCKDNPYMKINKLQCVPFLSNADNRKRFCNHALTKSHCCATRKVKCP